jgi:nucleoside-diphosphate-sugar epimerase
MGATGWFGRTVTALLHGLPHPTMFLSQRPRDYFAGEARATTVEWQSDAVAAFEPTTVIDCAFLTRDLVSAMSLDEYVTANLGLTRNLEEVASLESVRRVVTISSGAAVHPVDALTQSMDENPYGRLKREAEQSLASIAAERGIAAVIARAWSVSGAFVLKPRSYALSDMILQANEGAVHISAPMPVFRRYATVEDLLAVSLATASSTTPVIDSGGPLLEMQELAEAVVAVVNPRATISRSPMGDGEPNRYYAPAEPWEGACAGLSFTPASFDAQVRVTAAGVLGL